jgi:hypothetical protein
LELFKSRLETVDRGDNAKVVKMADDQTNVMNRLNQQYISLAPNVKAQEKIFS